MLANFPEALRKRARRLRAKLLKARQQHESSQAPTTQATSTPPPVVVDEDAAKAGFVAIFQAIADMPLHERILLERCRVLHSAGLSLLPLPPRSKTPNIAWREYQSTPMTIRRLNNHLTELGGDAGLAIVCGEVSGVVACDFDDEAGVAWAEQNLPRTPWRTKTARGEHWFFRIDGPWTPPNVGLPWKGELRANGAYVVAPGSLHPDGGRYQARGNWGADKKSLPLWSHAWLVDGLALRKERERILKRDS